MAYYLKRLLNDPLKLSVLLFIMVLPFFETIWYICELINYNTVTNPNFSTFLSAGSVGIGHIFQGVLLWFAPLYFLILCSEDCIQDIETGNINSLISKWGINKYIKINLSKSFLFSFSVVLISLIINLLITYSVFWGGTESSIITSMGEVDFYSFSVTHPLLMNIIYILLTSFIIGIISVSGTALAIALRKRKFVYPICLFIWYLSCTIPDSLLYATQPFTEYGLDKTYKTIIIFILINIIITIAIYIKETKYAKNKIF